MYKISVLKISGKDVKNFLQRIITNDIEQTKSFYSLILSPNGRYLFDFFVTQHDEGYYIEIEEGQADNFIKKLNQTKFRQDVKIEDLSDIFAFTYTKDPLRDAIITYKDPRYVELGYRNIISIEKKIDSGLDLYLQDKFKYSIPDGTSDMVYEKSMPQEFGLDFLGAINFRKGCYIGQEVISRIRTQGVVRKKIFKVTSDLSLKRLKNSDIIHQEQKIGILTSFMNKLGIAQIFIFDGFEISAEYYIENIPINLLETSWYKAKQ